MEIIEKKENKLLLRTEVVARDGYVGVTPSREAFRKKLGEALKVKDELIAIQHIYPSFGASSARIIAHIYGSRKELERIEPKHMLTKGVKGDKKGEQKPEAKKEEKKEGAD